MAFVSGTSLGPYQVLELVGSGGMGEVYRARDTKLKRDVAIKTLPGEFSRDADRLSRFQREAEVLASLNHPNIAAIYGLEEVDGTRCLILELVEGPTLADRIAHGEIPRNEALAIARQIAEALEAAHDRGIVHRDLKPANVKVRPDGTVKVLDFGLAKALDLAPAAEPVATMSPTLSLHATQAGIILGTAAYMSPEQASGKPVDRRTDIWSFGVVLWELLCAKRLFDGETVSHTLAAVLTKDPDWTLLPGGTPASVRRLIRRCVERDPKRRLPDIGSARLELDEAMAGATGGDTQVPSQAMRLRHWLAPTVVGALTVALVIVLVALWRATRAADVTEQSVMVQLDVDLGSNVSFASSTGPAVILSPDGTRLVFVAQASNGVSHLFTRRLEEPAVAQLSGTEGAYAPFFSPDGQWVGFFAAGKLKKTRIDGGEPVPLSDAPAGRGASWSEDGSIIAVLDTQVGLSQVPSEGGKAVPLTELGPGEVTHRWPHVLPGGAAVLFTAGATYGDFDRADIAVVSLKDRRTKVVLQDAGMNPRYLPTGHLAYVTRGTLFAVPFELDRLEARGSAAPLQEVTSDPLFGSAHIDVSRSGTIVYRSGRTEGLNTVQWLDGVGNTEPVITEPGGYLFPRLSRDGSRLLVRVNDETGTDLWVYDLRRGGNQRLTGAANLNSSPVWSPDGRFVVLQSLRGMFWTRADGAGESQPFAESMTAMFPNSFNRDGTLLAFSELTADGAEVRTMSVEGGSGQPRAGKPQLFVKTSTANAFPAFSPDGRWLAYADTAGGRFEVYVRAFPDNGTRQQISTAGGMMPIWSRTANELFYRTEDQRIMVASYTAKGESFVPERPRVWSGKPLANTGTAPNFDLAPDGKRFVVLMSAESPEPPERQGHVKIAVNFFDEVRRRTGVTR